MTSQALKEMCIKSYATFCRIMQDDGWFDPTHENLCNWIQWHVEHPTLELSGEPKDINLNVVLARGCLKSTIITKYFPVWMCLKDPNYRWLIATNTVPNARKKIEDIRGLFDSNNVFRALFPELLPKLHDRWTNEAAEIARTRSFPEATFECAGRRTRKTGTHYNGIIEDDTVAPADTDMGLDLTTPSTEELEQSIGWHKSSTSLLVPKGVRISIVVTTRWGEDDLVAYIRKHESYKVFDLPAQRRDGSVVFSTLYSPEKLEEIRNRVGPYMFSCLYLNLPMDASLRVFQKEGFQFYVPGDLVRKETDRWFRTIAIDPAISEKDKSCETAITETIHRRTPEGNAYQYWNRAIHGHMNPFQLIEQTLDWCEENPKEIRCIIVETNAYQASLKYYFHDAMIKREVNFAILPVHAHHSKNIRIEGMVPYFAGKRIFLSRSLPAAVESQLVQFPNGKLVDLLDSFSMHREVSPQEKKKVQ